MTEPTTLAELTFVDLYLGHDYADYSPLAGAHAPREDLPASLHGDAERVRGLCEDQHKVAGDTRFSVELGDEGSRTLCRVQMMWDLRNRPVYVLRRIAPEIRPITALGLPRHVVEFLLLERTRGLILVVGEQGTGKTTTAAAVLSARLAKLGGRGLAVEDPPETMLDGLHGPGRCLQVPVSVRHGSYTEQIHAGMRSGVSTLLIGEIRGAETGREAVTQSINGMTVVTTIHGADPVDGLQRLITWAEASQDGLGNAADILSSGISAVIHQRLERLQGKARAIFRTLLVPGSDDPSSAGIRHKIKTRDFKSLGEDIEQQLRRQQWNWQ